MQIVGFMEDEVQSVLELVAAVLKLGNIEFKPESRCNGTDESRIKDKNGEFDRWQKIYCETISDPFYNSFSTSFEWLGSMISLTPEPSGCQYQTSWTIVFIYSLYFW